MKRLLIIFLFQFLILVVESVWVKEMENPNLFEGDIMLDPDQLFPNGTIDYAIGRRTARWPNPVPYEIGEDMLKQPRGVAIIKEAIENYHKYTCIRFKPRTTEKGYMKFVWTAGCASFVGYRPGKANKIHLDSGCWNLGTVLHEIGHCLGLWHEHNRPDRDKYIDINWDNVKPEFYPAFEMRKPGTVVDYGAGYDLDSMMHYGTNAFAITLMQRTIRVRDYSKRLMIGQHRGFSNKDVYVLNKMYNCPTFHGTVPPKICKDTGVEDCKSRKRKGHCHWITYETKMYRDCCKTCFGHVAGEGGESKTWPPGEVRTRRPTVPVKPTKAGPCVDKESKHTCDYWARLGYCTTLTRIIREQTLAKCCATCKKITQN